MRRYLLLTFVLVIAISAWYGATRAAQTMYAIVSEMDRAEGLAELAPRPQATIVFDRHGEPVFSYFVEQRIEIPLTQVSPHVVDAVLAIEDKRFRSHRGLDPVRIVGAAWRNLKARRIVQGGSTVTQQLARVSQLTPVRTYARKMREVLIAARLEQRYSKEEILEQYLNTVYFGEGFYGVEAASRGYFSKPASQVLPHEAALLAALVRSPSRDAPRSAPERALYRRNLVLRLMAQQGRLTADEAARAAAEPLPRPANGRRAAGILLAGAKNSGLYFQEELRQQLVKSFGDERVLKGGLRVYSTYDPEMQRAAEYAIAKRLAQITGSRPKARDLQGSLIALDPKTGNVLAMVGGRSFAESQYNRATQARRQAGSAFKPIVFAAALERGLAPGTMLRELDAPIYAGYEKKPWLPQGGHERAEYTLRRALSSSSNRAAAHLLQQIGISSAIYYASRMGIESQLPMVPSLALGTGEVTLLELTNAYSAFANHGRISRPRLYTRVEDSEGTLLWEAQPQQSQAVTPTTAFLMSHMLADVVSRGTASNARAAGFHLPAAGKTGTTDDYTDAWFIGYTPHLVAGVWFGLDNPAPIMREGWAATVAVPAWAQFMRVATAGARRDWYETPPDVERVAICSLSGGRATDACRHGWTVYEPNSAYGVRSAGLTDSTMAATEPPTVRRASSYVYEDLFPIGAVPAENCWMHASTPPPMVTTTDSLAATPVAAPVATPAATPVATPLVDNALRQPGAQPIAIPVGTTGTAIPLQKVAPVEGPTSAPSIIDTGNGTKISIQRVVGADGVTRTIVKQIR
jgi:1A family penicillin-binding protein